MATPPDKVQQKLKLTQEALQKEEENDIALARSLSLLDQDRALAQALQTEEHQADGSDHLVQHLSIKERADARNQLNPILMHPSVNSTPGVAQLDAHTYTRTFIRENLPVLRAIDDQLRPRQATTILTPEQVLAELKQCYDDNQFRVGGHNIEGTFTRLALGITQNSNSAVDPETQQNVPELLSRCWTLAKAYDPANSIAKMASILSDNIGDGGGCLAGLVARLFAFQATTLGYILPASLYLPTAPIARQAIRPALTTTPQITPAVVQATVIPPVAMTTPQVTSVRPAPRPIPRASLTPEQMAQRAANLAKAAEYARQRR